jgi:hypothetical protein
MLPLLVTTQEEWLGEGWGEGEMNKKYIVKSVIRKKYLDKDFFVFDWAMI